MLFQKLVCGIDLKQLFIECEYVGFGYLSYVSEDIRFCLMWIQGVMSENVIFFQGLFVCCVFGQLVDCGRIWFVEDVIRYFGSKIVDFVFLFFEDLSDICLLKISIKYILIVVEVFFKIGFVIGCLFFIKYFCNVFDVKFMMLVLDKFLL